MTSGQAPPLPDRIESVIVPERFHPSTFVDLERCPLSVLGHSAVQSDGLLTIHPMAYLGIVLHHTRHEVVEGRWGGAKDATAAAADVLTLTVKFVEGELASRSITADLVPLSESVGRRRWKNSIRTLERWAAAQVVEGRDEVPRLPDLSDRVDRDVDEEGLRVTLGSEQGMADPSLRLRGRPDWSGRADDGRIEIVDFKSGRITDREGRLLDQHVAQLQLYSLMMEAAFPAATVVPLLEQDHRIQVPWEPIDRQLIRQRLDSVSIGLPSGETVAASDLAIPGLQCRTCRLRPQCGAYLDSVPEWWRGAGGSPSALPLDVFGRVTRADDSDGTVSLWINDAANRAVRVDGISPTLSVTSVHVGHQVWFFDLEASEDTHHGTRIHPRNFHQRAPGPRWKRARRVRVFVAEHGD